MKKNLQEVIATPNSERETVAAESTTGNAALSASINTIADEANNKRFDHCCYLINNLWDAYQAGPSEFYEDANIIVQLKEAHHEWEECIAAGRLDEYGKKVNERIQNMLLIPRLQELGISL